MLNLPKNAGSKTPLENNGSKVVSRNVGYLKAGYYIISTLKNFNNSASDKTVIVEWIYLILEATMQLNKLWLSGQEKFCFYQQRIFPSLVAVCLFSVVHT